MSHEPEGSRPTDDQAGERLRRLRRLGVRRGRQGLATSRPSEKPREKNGDPSAAIESPAIRSLKELAGAQEVFTPHGPCLVAETGYDLGEVRGGLPLVTALTISGAAAAGCARNPALADFDFHHAGFIDTETTGLSGGAGTYIFMIGIGMFEPATDRYIVRQVFMRHPGEEPALLHVTTSILARCHGLVSFNGRAFDVPLLNSRYAMHHQPSPLEEMPHLDLLPPSRQRWRFRLASCALGALEQGILDFQRNDVDVPGWLIPSLYQEYARSGNPTEMVRVFYHNREDIVSMVPLAAMLCAPFEGDGDGMIESPHHPADCASLGRSFEELGWLTAGERAYRKALDGALSPEIRSTVLNRLGWMLKRQERRDEAVAIWNGWITSVPGPDPTPHIELAKHHEWHGNDLAAARKWTLWGLHTAKELPPGSQREQLLSDLQHRLDRLDRKLSGTLPTEHKSS
ncbi:MAG: ribonuclease H-like domain-containing protein [Chloroflexota bacterium]|nr:ribonuclease H-like domain-containing protein [Chloroflexota bacterium]